MHDDVSAADDLSRWCHSDGRDHDGRTALWIAVIERAVIDRDLDWIRSSPAFAEVAALAGIEPNYARRKILADPEAARLRILGGHAGHSRMHVNTRDRRPKRRDYGPGWGLPGKLQVY